MTRWAKITHRFSRLHRWPDAPSHVRFLSYLHRHLFHVTLWVEEEDKDRDVEFLTMLEELKLFVERYDFPESSSCEDIAQTILEHFDGRFHSERKLKCEVSEDGENGALLEL